MQALPIERQGTDATRRARFIRGLPPASQVALSVGLLLVLLPACSIRRYAVNQIGNALASGGSTYESDDDLDLVGGALPFSLKLIESLLAESPQHAGLLLAATSGFTQYGYVYVDEPADEASAESLERANLLRQRARRLYLRAHGYGMRALERRYPGIGAALATEPKAALARTRRRDIPLLYWTAAAEGLAISNSKNDAEMIARLPEAEALIDRVVELDEAWGEGSVHEFLISMDGARAAAPAAEVQARLRRHFDRAVELSRGARGSVFVTYAEASSVRFQRRAEFQSLLKRALAINADARPDIRLMNLVAQRRARWLLGRTDALFLETTEEHR